MQVPTRACQPRAGLICVKAWPWWLLACGLFGLVAFAGYRWAWQDPPAAADAASAGEGTGVPAATRRGGPETVAATARESEHIRKVGDLAFAFYDRHRRLPHDMAEVREWAVRERGANPEAFRSPRDGQVYEFLNGGLAVVERTGKNGRRLAYHPVMGLVELSQPVVNVIGTRDGVPPNVEVPAHRGACRPVETVGVH